MLQRILSYLRPATMHDDDMPIETNVEAFRYGNRFLAELIKDAFDKIVYTSVQYFDQVFVEFDRICTGERSSMLPELSDLFHNEYQVIETDKNQLPIPEKLTAFRQQILERMEAEKIAFQFTYQREVKLKARPSEPKRAQPKGPYIRVFPKAIDREIMATFDIDPMTLEPEYRLCVNICMAQKLITLAIYERNIDPVFMQTIEHRLQKIYSALGITHQTNLNHDQLRRQLSVLDGLKELFDQSKLTIRQVRNLPLELKTYLCTMSNQIMDEINIDNIDATILAAYLSCRKLAVNIAPDLANDSIYNQIRLLKLGLNKVELSIDARQECRHIFKEFCAYEIDSRVNDNNLCQMLLVLLGNIQFLVIPYSLDLAQFYKYSQDTIEHAWLSREEIDRVIDETNMGVQQLLALPSKSRAILFSYKPGTGDITALELAQQMVRYTPTR